MTVAALKVKVERATRDALRAEDYRRTHLGASLIGGRCVRAAWYAFRWAYDVDHTGRIRRLFNRGHEEEHRLVRWLRTADIEVRDYAQRLLYCQYNEQYYCVDWDQAEWADDLEDVSQDRVHIMRATAGGVGPKQWGFEDHEGHFAGSSDGKIRGDNLPPGWGGAEFKTHSDKSYKEVEKKGVLSSKPVHWVQMQIYLHYLKLDWCLYVAVNKNDDDLYFEIVHYKPEVAAQYVDMARAIIFAQHAPKRITEDPSWFECKFCDFREVCHKGEAPEKNCRSCVYASPVADKGWTCNKYTMLIPTNFIPVGCDAWQGNS